MKHSQHLHWHIIYYDQLLSTNTQAWENIKNHQAKNKDVVVTYDQHQGYGKNKSTWLFFPGNLACSIILQSPSLLMGKWITMMMSIALCKCIEDYVLDAYTPCIKWPNDVLIHNKKIAGILTESQSILLDQQETLYFVVGVGMNIQKHPATQDTLSLQEVMDHKNVPLMQDFLHKCLSYMDNLEEVVMEFPLRIIEEWNRYGWKIGQFVDFQTTQGERISGVLEGMDENGDLIFMGHGGNRIPIHSGHFLI